MQMEVVLENMKIYIGQWSNMIFYPTQQIQIILFQHVPFETNINFNQKIQWSHYSSIWQRIFKSRILKKEADCTSDSYGYTKLLQHPRSLLEENLGVAGLAVTLGYQTHLTLAQVLPILPHIYLVSALFH